MSEKSIKKAYILTSKTCLSDNYFVHLHIINQIKPKIMEAFYYITFGIVCFTAGSVISHQYTKAITKLNIKSRFKDYFKNHKNIGYPKSKDLI